MSDFFRKKKIYNFLKMKRKNKKKTLVALSTFFLCGLTGCQLAVEEVDPRQRQGDRLVGAFVTNHHLDTFDMEGWLSDHAGKLVDGGEVLIDETDDSLTAQKEYQNRIYGEIKEDVVVFPGLEGHATIYIEKEDQGTFYKTAIGDGEQTYMHIKSTDQGEETELTDQIYVSEDGSKQYLFCVNPIYQTEQGEIYTVSGNSMAFGEGSCAMTLSEDTTVTKDQQKETQKFTYIANFEIKKPVKEYRLLQFDSDHQLTKQEILTTETVIVPEDETEYLLLEGIGADGDVQRTYYDQEDEQITCYTDQGKWFLETEMIEVEWNDERLSANS